MAMDETCRTKGERGCYLLTLWLPAGQSLNFGRCSRAFAAGYYAYCGSAQGGLRGRLARHLRSSRRPHWHIDSLLAKSTVVDLQAWFDRNRQAECSRARDVENWPGAESVEGFGAGDCACRSHLTYFRERPLSSLRAPAMLSHLAPTYGFLNQRYHRQMMWERDPFQTLIGCILSLRTQDPVTEKAMKRLFEKYSEPAGLLAAPIPEVAKLIYPVGMYNQKARTINRIAGLILERFAGQTPCEIDDLLELPGVGRKTANLVRSFAFGLDAICVDTHVHRICNRWGLVRTATPEQSETELRRILPRQYWIETNHLLVQHGQSLCRPLRPKCPPCGLREYCQYADLQREEALRREIPEAPPHPSLKFPEITRPRSVARKP